MIDECCTAVRGKHAGGRYEVAGVSYVVAVGHSEIIFARFDSMRGIRKNHAARGSKILCIRNAETDTSENRELHLYAGIDSRTRGRRNKTTVEKRTGRYCHKRAVVQFLLNIETRHKIGSCVHGT